MSQTFGDLELAAKTKEVLSTLVRKEVKSLRPIPRYATVASLDPLTVTYAGDPTPMPVKTGSVVPSAVGQVVRVEGPLGDRYIADVVNAEAGVSPYTPVVENPDGGIDLGDGTTIDGTPPGDVTGLTVTQGLEFENIYFIIEWDLIAGAASYDVEVAEKLGANTYDLTRALNVGTTTARVDGLQPYTEYGVRVTAVSNIGVRGNSTVWLDVTTTGDNTIPPQVSLPVLSRGATSLIVNFDPVDALAAPDVANGNGLYEVQIDTVNTFDSANLRSSLGTSSLVAFSDLTFTATWYARVRAIDTSGNIGAWSNTASLLAGQIVSGEIADDTITSDHIVTAGLDAAVIKFGTMSGDRITANTISVDKLTTSTLTSKTITLGAGGQIKIGNPTTNGIYINDQGIRGYSGGVATFILDQNGNATFSGTLSGAGGTFSGSLSAGVYISAPSIVGGTIDIGGSDSTSFHVDSAGNMWLGASTYASAPFKVSSTGALTATSGTFSGNITGAQITGSAFRTDSGGTYIKVGKSYIGETGTNIVTTISFVYSNTDVGYIRGTSSSLNLVGIPNSIESGTIVLGSSGVDVYPSLRVQGSYVALSGHTHSGYASSSHTHSSFYSLTIGTGDLTLNGRLLGTGMTRSTSGGLAVRMWNGTGYEVFGYTSSGKLKANSRVDKAINNGYLNKMLQVQIPVWDAMSQRPGKDPKPIAVRPDLDAGTVKDRIGPIVEDMATTWKEAVLYDENDQPFSIDKSLILATIWHGFQELVQTLKDDNVLLPAWPLAAPVTP